MRLGAPVFVTSDDPEVLARAHRELGLRAAYCPRVAVGDGDRIRAVSRAFARQDVVIAEVGVWNNLLDPAAEVRQRNARAMQEGLALADEIGALCVVNIAGTRNPDQWAGPHPDNFQPAVFDEIVAVAREIIDAVHPVRAKFTYEMMPWCFPDSAQSYLDLVRAIDRPAFGVHLDVVNIVCSVRRYFENTALIRECFELLGPQIVCCHLKDIRLSDELTTHLSECLVGTGGLDNATYLREVARLPHHPPVLLEHLHTAEEYEQARHYTQGLARELGIDFEQG